MNQKCTTTTVVVFNYSYPTLITKNNFMPPGTISSIHTRVIKTIPFPLEELRLK